MNSTMEEFYEKRLFFGWLDFTLFGMMLAVSTIIGIYYGFWGKEEDSPKEYLHGGKKMKTLPVAVSLISCFLSGVTSLGAPTEIYVYGTMYSLICFSCLLIGIANYYIYLPVFYEMQLTSTYEYLQIRFNQTVRVMASLLCTLGLLLYIPIVVYVPALAFSQVSGLNVHYITPVIATICIFYTMLGGIKAVIWTDFLQGIITLLSSIAVVILGVVHVGGFETVWQRNRDGGRISFFEMSLSPFERMTFWSVIIGYTFHWGGMINVNQAIVQKFLSLPTYKNAKMALYIFVVGLVVVNAITCYIGMVMFAAYHDCDPLESKVITKPDQVLPYYVTDIGASVPGLAGLFVAGIFSSSLSTMSSSMNALGATLFEDFVRPCLKKKISDKVASNIIKLVVVIIGIICVLNVFIVDKLGTILQVTVAAVGVTNGAMLGLFSFGMLYPRGNSKGALAGSIISMVIMGWIVIGNQTASVDGRIKQPTLPTSVQGCEFNITKLHISLSEKEEGEVFFLYRISFMIYTLMGWFIMFIVGIVVSLITEPPNQEKLNPSLFAPFIRNHIKKKKRRPINIETTELHLLRDFATKEHEINHKTRHSDNEIS